MSPRHRIAARALLLAPAVLLVGCVDRTISITSAPSGALLYLNDQEIGRTPCSVSFTFHGTYDVRLTLDGYEPLLTQADTRAPIYDIAPIDLLAEIAPANLPARTAWHFTLMPINTEPSALRDRAAQMRAKLEQDIPVTGQSPTQRQDR